MICNECTKNYADSLDVCPYCGASNIKKSKFFLMRWSNGAVLTLISAIGLVIALVFYKAAGISIMASCILCSILHFIKLYNNTSDSEKEKMKTFEFLSLCVKNEEPFVARYDFVSIALSVIGIIISATVDLGLF